MVPVLIIGCFAMLTSELKSRCHVQVGDTCLSDLGFWNCSQHFFHQYSPLAYPTCLRLKSLLLLHILMQGRIRSGWASFIVFICVLWTSHLFNGRYNILAKACDVSFGVYFCFTTFGVHKTEYLIPCILCQRRILKS